MSVDISNPLILSTRNDILTPTNPTVWFILSYATHSPSPSLQLLQSGGEPALDGVRGVLEETKEEVLFGYAEVGGKGLVVVYLKDNVGGVRRARAVVHSRAVASLFPDYAALITVAHYSQLGDGEVYAKLGFVNGLPSPSARAQQRQPSSSHHDPQPVLRQQAPSTHSPVGSTSNATSPSTVQRANSTTAAAPVALGAPISPSRHSPQQSKHHPLPLELPARAISPVETSPPVPEKDYPISTSTSQPIQRISSNHSTPSIASRSSTRSRLDSLREPRTPTLEKDLNLAGEGTPIGRGHLAQTEMMTTPSGNPAPLPRAPPVQINTHPNYPSHHYPSNRIVSAPTTVHSIDTKGISSAEMFENQRGHRKTSLSSRLGQLGSAFTKSSPRSPSSSNPSSPITSNEKRGEPGSPTIGTVGKKSPGSPNVARFMNSNLIKGFGRRSSSGNGPVSPETAVRRTSQPPPLPPKDAQDAQDGKEEVVDMEDGYGSTPPQSGYQTAQETASGSTSLSMSATPSGQGSIGHLAPGGGGDGEVGLIRSGSAQKALFEASQKRLKDESEVQERYRRDEESRKRRSGGSRLGVHDAAYDQRFSTVGGIFASAASMGNGHNLAQRGTREDEGYRYEDEEEVGLPYDRPESESETQSPQRKLRLANPNPSFDNLGSTRAGEIPVLGGVINGSSDTPTPFARGESSGRLQPHEGLGDDVDGDESVTARIAELDLAEDGQAGGTDIEMSIAAEKYAEGLKREREATAAGLGGQAGTTDVEEEDGGGSRGLAGGWDEGEVREMEEDMNDPRVVEYHRQYKEFLVVAKKQQDKEAAERQRRAGRVGEEGVGVNGGVGGAVGRESREQAKLEELAMERRLEPIRMAEDREREERASVDHARVEEQRRVEEEQRRQADLRLEEERQRANERAEEERRIELERMEEEQRLERERIEKQQRLERERIAEEERLEKERVEDERRREQERLDEIKRKEEERIAEEKRREEERIRVEEERVRGEEKKREDTLNGLRRGKSEGGKMLSGWITVQSIKSTIWRRRHFELFPTEMRLFKGESDAKPISVVPLGKGINVSLSYEESQVQSSFKLVDEQGEVWFMFTDGPEEKGVVLTALGIIAE